MRVYGPVPARQDRNRVVGHTHTAGTVATHRLVNGTGQGIVRANAALDGRREGRDVRRLRIPYRQP